MIRARVMPVYPRARSLGAAMSARPTATVKQVIDHCIDTVVCVALRKDNSSYSNVQESSTGDVLPHCAYASNANAEREAERDVYATKLRAAMERKEQNIIAELVLSEIRRITPIKHLKARLVLVYSRKDQKKVDSIAKVLERKIANKRRMNKKKRDNKKRNKRYVRVNVASSAENVSVIAANESANSDVVPEPA